MLPTVKLNLPPYIIVNITEYTMTNTSRYFTYYCFIDTLVAGLYDNPKTTNLNSDKER